ncbi:uncharacterized protein LOC121718821 isoform X11 [Alosa sapidissima]|uniref:uncharacterized protein LOC121718821 isoform X11 n=1 Tax=Alosa sapidissima TaxID=34773 RepID=UPI001C0944F0|nr:uncharacterized protein LOC121718821 isoform X11 [Alosa sapidissima]
MTLQVGLLGATASSNATVNLSESDHAGQRCVRNFQQTKPRTTVSMNEVRQHMDLNHKQACIDLEKATQCIIQAFQHEVDQNQELCMLIRRLEEKEAEIGRSLTEQVEANKQLKLKIDELQKHLEEKNNSLTQANQQIKSPSSPVQSDQLMAADEPLVWSEQMISPEVQSVLASSDGQIPPVSSDGHILLISSDGQTHAEAPVSGIKEENAVHGYEECSQYETRLEYIVTSAADIKLEQIQTPLVSSDDQRLLEAPVSEDEDGDDDEYEEYSHPDVTLTKVDVMIIKVKYQDIKKYIKICEPCLDMFMTEVRVKFSINEDKTLIVTDDGGMEVDADVFPELVTKDMCLVIHDSDEESPIPEFSSSLTDTCSLPSSQDSGTTLSLCKRACLEEDVLQCAPARELVKKVLLEKPGGAAIMKEYEDTGSLCDSSRRQMVNILAAHMTETEGRIPQRLTKEKYALGVITLFPYLKDPFSKKGYEHFYDAQSGTGFIAWRLKTIQRKTKLRPPSSGSPKADGGPTVARNISQDQLQDEACEEAISLMTHTNDRETIFQKMQETFQYRQRLIHNPATSAKVLSVFPRLLDTKGLVLQDFSLLVGSETSARLLERWPSFKPKLIKEGAALVQTPLLQRLLLSAREEQVEPSADNLQGWDSDMSTLLLLLHILSPQAAGRKRSHKISASRAIDNLVVFHKSCQSLDEHLNEDERRQPYLLASGTSKRAINNFYIAMDKKLIPCQGNTSLAAFDELFKVHFVFSLSYDESLCSFFTFLQTTVYNIDVGTTKESPKVKELRAKLMNNV